MTDTARRKFVLSNFPCVILFLGYFNVGKSSICSHLCEGNKTDFMDTEKSTFKISNTNESCTRSMDAVGPIKCRKFASMFNILPDDAENVNLDRDIFIIDSEGINSNENDVTILKQTLCSTFPMIDIIFYVSSSMGSLDEYMKYSQLIQYFEKMNVFHSYGYIISQAKFGNKNVMQNLLKQNEKSTNSILKKLSSQYDDIIDSHYKCFSVLSFDRHKNDYINSLTEVAHFIVQACLYNGSLINGHLMVNVIEKFANQINEIDSNLKNQKMLDQMKDIFIKSVYEEFDELIQKQEVVIKERVQKELLFINYNNIHLLNINEFIKKCEEEKLIDQIINNAINGIGSNFINFDDSIKKLAHERVTSMIKSEFKKEKDKKVIGQNEISRILTEVAARLNKIQTDQKEKFNNYNEILNNQNEIFQRLNLIESGQNKDEQCEENVIKPNKSKKQKTKQ